MVYRSDWRCIQMAKMGRPKSDAPKLNTLSVRVTDSELQKMRKSGFWTGAFFCACIFPLLNKPDGHFDPVMEIGYFLKTSFIFFVSCGGVP